MKNKLSAPVLTALFVAILISAACTRKMAVQSTSSADVWQVNKDARDPVYLNDINIKVLRSFYMTYGELPGAKWFKSANGFLVRFKHDGMDKIVYYKRSGLVDCEILYYPEDRLAQEVRHFVKSRFYDYSIFHITEVRKNGATAYYVKVQDATTIKTIKVVEEEWEVVESLVKR
jgi:hypothetical protein